MVHQYVDERVSRAKFDRELEEFQALESEYRRRGWLLVESDFPTVVFVMAAPQLNPPPIVTGVAFDYTNYDIEPPSVHLVNPFTFEPYLAKQLPTTLNRAISGLQQIAVPGFPGGGIRINQIQPLMVSHSPDEVPFLCIAGVREYHSHPAHTGDAWELHRTTGAGRLVRLLEVIHKYGIEPIQRYAVQLTPQVAGFESPVAPE
jgi:hypothetical protein